MARFRRGVLPDRGARRRDRRALARLDTAFALLGPTASGKSRLALQLAERLPIEIVSVDSAQVYRGMDIGTAKPDAAERERVPHHLIDLLDPDQRYSAGRFCGEAIDAVAGILERGKVPLLVGGTMLYYRSLVHGLDELPQADPRMRKEIDDEARARGWGALHAELERADPHAARRIMPGDSQRIQRALEVLRLTGKPLSSLQHAARPPLPFHLQGACLTVERVQLHAAIEQRFDTMLRTGLVDEVRGLRARYRLDATMPSMRAVGYRQVWEHLEGGCDTATMRSRALAATRQLAKRQMTWLRAFPELVRLDGARPQEAAETLLMLLTRFCTRRAR